MKSICMATFFVLSLTTFTFAHFGMIIPSDSMVMQDDERTLDLKLSFSHPFEGHGMELVKPAAFFVVKEGEKTNLLDSLSKTTVMGHGAWSTRFPVRRPGAYIFCMEPVPYWEPAEDCFIVHYTKTVVAAYGQEEGWDGEAGLKTEIVPLSKPYGLYAGNLFQGIVKVDGKAVPWAEVEIEYYNKDKKATAPTDYMVTQTIHADGNGVFGYAPPVAGWWGFAGLSTSDQKMVYEGEQKNIELGAVIWVQFLPWQAGE